MYEELRIDRILKTLEALRSRIEERFPASGLAQVAAELLRIARDTEPFLQRVRRPNWPVRIGVGVAVLVLLALPVLIVMRYRGQLSTGPAGAGDLLQQVESAVQDVVFLGLAIYFLLNLEGRLHRNASLKELHRLRTIVHIVDMHQLTKDPEHLLTPGAVTASSPERQFSRFELSRYLDYCSELLAISSKLAALHAQSITDPAVLEAVSDIEVLASNLANRIGQKIMILESMAVAADASAEGAPVTSTERAPAGTSVPR